MNRGAISAKLAAAIAAILAGCVVGTAALAADVVYEASVGAGHSDNIRRTVNNETDEDIAAVGLRFSIDELRPRLEGRAVADLAYHEYLDDAFDSDFIGNFAGDARIALAPERLDWIIADNFGQVLADPFTPATPDNRENINYFTTGPVLSLPLGAKNRVRLGAQYSLISYEDSPFDSDAVSANLALVRALSASTALSLNARAQQVEYDEAGLNADYDQQDAFVRYEATGIRTELGVDVGYTQVDRDAASDSEDGLLLRLDLSRRLSGASTATLSAGREFSNSGSAFATTQELGGIGSGATPGRQTGLPFTHEYVALGWNFSRNRTGFGFSVSRTDQSYEDDASSGLDQTLSSVSGRFSRQLSTRTALAIDVGYGEGEFAQGTDYDELNGSLSVSWRLSRSLSLTAMYDYYEYETLAGPEAGKARENRFWLSLGFGNGTPRQEYAPPEFAIDERT
jgi:hypothetical protein